LLHQFSPFRVTGFRYLRPERVVDDTPFSQESMERLLGGSSHTIENILLND
jgi:hypothetical protein